MFFQFFSFFSFPLHFRVTLENEKKHHYLFVVSGSLSSDKKNSHLKILDLHCMNDLFLHSWVVDMSQTLFLRPQQFLRGKDISLRNPGKPRGVPLSNNHQLEKKFGLVI